MEPNNNNADIFSLNFDDSMIFEVQSNSDTDCGTEKVSLNNLNDNTNNDCADCNCDCGDCTF